MSRKTKLQVIKEVLDDHSPLAYLFSEGMELQVLARQDDGIPYTGSYKGISYQAFGKDPYIETKVVTLDDGSESIIEETKYKDTWKSFRIPRNASTTPEYRMDSPMTFDRKHISAIGQSGWNWVEKVSKYVVFDFDSLIGHSANNPNMLTDEQLEEVRERVSRLDWVTIIRSTSGTGYHLYVFVDDIPCENHSVHASLAKGILDKMSLECSGYDFGAKIDVCGYQFWMYHDKMFLKDGKVNPRAFELVQQGRTLGKDELPENWREYKKAIESSGTRNVSAYPVLGIRKDLDDAFYELIGRNKRIPLDDEHKRLIEYLKTRKDAHWFWSGDSNMLVTHTCVLKDAHIALGLKGLFDTTSGGSNLAEQNCFCYPLPDGAWSVLRYGKGVKEADSWLQESDKHTRCYYNQLSDYYSVCRHYGGTEDPEEKTFHFESTDILVDLLKALESDIEVPRIFFGRGFKLIISKKTSKVSINIDIERDDPNNVEKWIRKPRPNRWYKVTEILVLPSPVVTHQTFDSLFRHVTLEGEGIGWRLKNSNDVWVFESLHDVRNVAKSKFPTINDGELTRLIGKSTDEAWMDVNVPFAPEYTGSRSWNFNASKLSQVPSKKPLGELSTPTWDKVLGRLGRALDEPISKNKELSAVGIYNGGSYLKAWIASMLQFPFKKTPFLFFFGTQDSGKSTFHEAISMLFDKGSVSGKEALSNPSGFNGELRSAIFVYVEEKDLSKDKEAYTRLKDYVTGLTMPLNMKYSTPVIVRNTSHWCQFGNSHLYVPLEDGDTRVTVIEVAPLTASEKIGKDELMSSLKAEIKDFLGVVMQLELPKLNDRLTIPVIDTKQKRAIAFGRRNELQTFLEDKVRVCKGNTLSLTDFFTRFQNWLEDSDKTKWSTQRVNKELPTEYPRGRLIDGEGTCFIANLAWVDGSMDLAETKELSVDHRGMLVETT